MDLSGVDETEECVEVARALVARHVCEEQLGSFRKRPEYGSRPEAVAQPLLVEMTEPVWGRRRW